MPAPLRLARRASPLLALLGLLTSGCARLEAQTACFTLSDYPIPWAPASGALSTRIVYDLGSDLPLLSDPGVSYTLSLERLDLSVAAGSPVDLGGIETLEVSVVAPRGSSLPQPTLVRYVKGTEPHPTTLRASSASGDDLAPYLSGGRVTLGVTATGALPARAWAADVKGCFLLTVDVDYGKKL